ncbi:uncharacterized protein LOC100183407 [Ciona intestinalis]
MDNSSEKKMAPALHNTEHEPDTIKHCFKLPPDSPESALTVRNDTVYTKMNGSYSPLSPVSDDVHESTPDMQDEFNSRPLNHKTPVAVPPYSNHGGSGDFVTRSEEHGTRVLQKTEECQSVATHCGDGLVSSKKSNGWPKKCSSEQSEIIAKVNGTKNHVTDVLNSETNQEKLTVNGNSHETKTSLTPFSDNNMGTKTTNSLNNISVSEAVMVSSAATDMSISVDLNTKPHPQTDYPIINESSGENSQTATDVTSQGMSTSVSANILNNDSVPMDISDTNVPQTVPPLDIETLKTASSPAEPMDTSTVTTAASTTETLDVKTSISSDSDVTLVALNSQTEASVVADVTNINNQPSSTVSMVPSLCLAAGSSETTHMVSQAETVLTYKARSPISSHCVYDSKLENVEQPNEAKPDLVADLKVPDLLGLARDLITGNHMQHLPLKLTNTLQELAASLTRGQSEKVEPTDSVKPELPASRRRSSKSLNFEPEAPETVTGITNMAEIRNQHLLQHADVVRRRVSLEGRLNLLSRRLNRIRAASFCKHLSTELSDVSDSVKPEKHPINSSPIKTSLVAKDLEVWRNILSRKLSDRRPFTSDGQSFNGALSSENSGVLHSNDALLSGVTKPVGLELYKQIRDRTGLVKKELDHLTKVFDGDVTDSSSDEETTDTVYRGGECIYPCNVKNSSTTQGGHLNLKERKRCVTSSASWRWANERTSVAKRWTWLQAQVSDLEFKIRQHTEMHRQMRLAKGEAVFCEQSPHTSPVSVSDITIPATTQSGSQSPTTQIDSKISTNKGSSTDSPSPFNVTKLVNNVHRQTSNLLDNLSPLSARTPSPSEKLQDVKSATPEPTAEVPPTHQPTSGFTHSSARTRPLRSKLRKRRIVCPPNIEFLNKKSLKPPRIPNDGSIMCSEFEKQTPFQRCDGRFLHPMPASFNTRAANHDHSYHKTLSSKQDVPLSLRLSSFMTNNIKWYKEKKSGKDKQEKKNKRKQKEAKREERTKNRTKSATVVHERSDKLIRSMSALQRNTSMDERSFEPRKRRGSVQLMAEFNKRNRVASVDSDAELHHHRSGASTPTEASLGHSGSGIQLHALMKRKRAADQAYDINNIVIPQHGLTAPRIEKLQYKEIQTPGWRPIPNEEAAKPADVSPLDDAEDVVEDLLDTAYQIRHDRYEILEKKKYVAYMEWSMNKKNGTRVMSRANLPTTSPFFDTPSLRDSPTPNMGSPEIPVPSSPEEASGGSPAPLVRSRRSSSDHNNIQRASVMVTPIPDMKPPLRESLSSEDGRPARARPMEESWAERCFPLNDEDFHELMKTPVVENTPSFSGDSSNRFRPIGRTGPDTNTAFKYKTPKSIDGLPAKRRRTDSTLSSVSRDDDRHSDGSTTSSYSARPSTAHKEVSPTQPRRHKPTIKPDFYVYSDLDTDTESQSTDSADEEPQISGDDRPEPYHRHSTNSARWFAKPVDGHASPPVHRTPTVEQKGPLLLKIKKK